MKNDEIKNFNIQENYIELTQFEPSDLIINNQPDCFIEDEDKVFLNPPNDNENKNSHSNSMKTNATYGEIDQNVNEVFSFGNENININFNNINNINNKKEMTKESMDILNNFIQKEKNIMNLHNNNINLNINLNYEINIKNIKNNLININDRLCQYFKRPYMRKNLKKSNGVFDIKNIYNCKNIEEDEKIQFDKKNIEELKDYDSKTNDSIEDEDNLIDNRKKFK